MNFLNDFNAEDHQDEAFSTIEPGKYELIAESIEEKETKAGTGKFLSVKFQVISEESNGRVIYTNYNIENPNDVAVKIGKQQFSSFCKSVGVLRPKAVEDLINKPFTAEIDVKFSKYKNENVNYIKKYIFGSTTEKAAPKVETKKEKVPPWKK